MVIRVSLLRAWKLRWTLKLIKSKFDERASRYNPDYVRTVPCNPLVMGSFPCFAKKAFDLGQRIFLFQIMKFEIRHNSNLQNSDGSPRVTLWAMKVCVGVLQRMTGMWCPIIIQVNTIESYPPLFSGYRRIWCNIIKEGRIRWFKNILILDRIFF